MREVHGKVLLDTNLVLLFLVAKTDRSLIGRFKRVNAFAQPDISLLSSLLNRFSSIVTTPHVLTEVSNLLGQAPTHSRGTLRDELRRFIDSYAEIYETAQVLSRTAEYQSLGLSDAALAHLGHECTVLTVDFRLAGRVRSSGGHSINFNHYRSTYLLNGE